MSAADGPAPQTSLSAPLLAAALLLLLALKVAALAAFGPTIAPDSRDYIGYADQILSGAFRHVDLVSDAIPLTLYRPIGYPAVVAAAKVIAPGHWAWAVVLLQFAVSLVATAMVYRLARGFGLAAWLSLGAAAAYATSLQFVLDQTIASDSLCASTLTIATCLLAEWALRRAPPRPLLLLAAGALIAASFLMRDVIAFIALGLVPLTLASVSGAKGWPRRAAAFVLVFLPLIGSYVGYVEWNRSRVGAAVVTTVAQWSLLDPLVRASRYDPTLFSADDPIAQTGRRVAKNFTLDESLEADKILHRDFGWDAVRTAREVTSAYLRAWFDHPAAMVRHALGFLSESQLHQAVRPTETVRDVLLWNTGSDQEFAREAAVRDGNWWMIPAVVVHRLCETISTLVFAAFLLVTPLRLVREGVTAQTGAAAGLWFAYLVCLGLHTAVAVHPRYLLPVLADSIVVGTVNIVWLVARWRTRSSRAGGGSTEGSGITAGSR
jgi:4-amino-4-deoxy-L-arabinose transferase-like glycosyltransferase